MPARIDPYNVVMEVTPSMAARWLEGNTHNRPVNQAHVERLAGDMKAGRWRATHQGIAFSPSQVLLDGQHRLWAIVLADRAISLRVFFNEPVANIECLDGGLSRGIADRMTLSDRFAGGVSKPQLATLRGMVRGLGSQRSLSYGEEAELLARHLDAVRFSMQHLPSGDRTRGVSTAVTHSVVARAYYSVEHESLIHFCTVLRNGLATGPADEPIILLRDFLARTEKRHNALAVVREEYGKVERALKAHLRGERVAKLYGTNLELFPLPEETNPSNRRDQ